jgi:hypothetical protein
MSKSRANGGVVESSEALGQRRHAAGIGKVLGRQRHAVDEAHDERLRVLDPRHDGSSNPGLGGQHGVVVLVVPVDAELPGLAHADSDHVVASVSADAVVAIGHPARDRCNVPGR